MQYSVAVRRQYPSFRVALSRLRDSGWRILNGAWIERQSAYLNLIFLPFKSDLYRGNHNFRILCPDFVSGIQDQFLFTIFLLDYIIGSLSLSDEIRESAAFRASA
jgi:hypothetical protein